MPDDLQNRPALQAFVDALGDDGQFDPSALITACARAINILESRVLALEEEAEDDGGWAFEPADTHGVRPSVEAISRSPSTKFRSLIF